MQKIGTFSIFLSLLADFFSVFFRGLFHLMGMALPEPQLTSEQLPIQPHVQARVFFF